jgi:hypothetical protein|tara:strand:- start:973 stop:1227 length:255 start_codon:yes stop_codon:yes gene_type:complete
MREWFKKYLGWLGFGALMVSVIGTVAFGRSSILGMGPTIWATCETIQGILNEKYFKKYSEKVKNRIIVLIVTVTIGMFCILIFL